MTAIAVLAAVVVFLFKWADGRITKSEATLAQQAQLHIAELGRRDAREVEIRRECDVKLAEMAARYADVLHARHVEARAHEDAIRKEFTAIVASISDQTRQSAEALTEVLGRLHDRVTGAKSKS